MQSANTIGSRDLGPISTSIEDSGFTIPTISAPVPPRSEEYDRSHQNADGAEKDTTQSDDIAVQKSLGIDGTPKESQTVGPSTTLPLLADDASKPSDPVLQQLEVGSKPDGAHTVRPPPKEKQEERLEDTDSSRDGHVPKPSSGTDLAEGRSSAHSGDHAHHSLSQSRQEFEPEVPPAQPSENDGSLESQIGLSREATAVGGSSFTPDEQLRLEEAQSLQGHVTDLHARVSTPQTPDTTVAKEAPSAPEQANKDAELEAQTGNIEFKPFDNYRRGQRIVDEASEISGFRNSAYPGLAGDVAKDVTFSQRPPMRIDTELSQQAEQSRSSSFKKPLENNAAVTHTPPDSATSARASHSSAPAQSPPERMTTRVSSGALRHKSVSEILGETSKPVTPHTDKASNERTTTDTNRDAAGLQSPRSSVSVTSPDTAAFRLRLNELKEKDKSKLSTVIFARKQPLQPTRHSENLRHREPDVTEEKTKNTDYFYPLIHAQAATPPRAQLLNRLIGSAAKTLTTANHYVDYHEQQDCRILSKIEQLQKANRWSLRQMERSAEPERPTVHWDVLLSQMKWLRTDFREERKWKIAAASSVANWCAQWVSGSKEERVALQVKVRPQPHVHSAASRSTPTPDLIPSAEDDSSDGAEDEVGNVDVFSGKAPAAIFSMAPDTFYFGLQKTPSAEKLLQELPLYHPSLEVQQAALHHSRVQSDKDWKTPLLPVSKFGDGKLLSHDEGPPRKKSRYDYAELDEVHQFSLELPDSDPRTLGLRPEQDDVALFNPENKHIRDRIHAGHAFRPPSEHVMPSQSFFESRHASQWTQSEDDELRRLVREYAYNWSLISSCLSVPSSFSSAAERRTPWECFERWIGLEGLPAEMAKTQYFRAYHARLQAAQTTHEAQQQLLQQQQGNNAPLRRRSTQPFLVERRRNTKHVHLVNAMKNLARKREAVPKKAEKGSGSVPSLPSTLSLVPYVRAIHFGHSG